MGSSRVFASLAVVLLTIVIASCHGCQNRQGCRIQAGVCLCGIGCEYRYSSQQECRKALGVRRNDVCRRVPCLNGGTCIQSMSNEAGYKCRCEGTGFHGKRCERACPQTHNYGLGRVESFPHECIVI